MRFFACPVCHHLYQVSGPIEELKSLLNEETAFPCITNFCEGRMHHARGPVEGFRRVEVPLSSFFRAINGFGLSSGAPASAKKFMDIVTKKKIVDAVVEPVGQPERVILRKLIVEDGTRFHFDTSARGACCFFIEEVGPSCLEVFDAEPAGNVEAADRVSDTDREETGRAPEIDGEPADEGASQPSDDATAPEQPRSDDLSLVSEAGSVPEVPTSGPGDNSPDLRVRTPGNSNP